MGTHPAGVFMIFWKLSNILVPGNHRLTIVTMELPWSYHGVTMELPWSYHGVTIVSIATIVTIATIATIAAM